MRQKHKYFSNLDSIRFVAAMMVFMQHVVSPCFKYLNIEGTTVSKVLAVFSNGGVGVSIFFVLSGFLITYLILTEIDETGKLNLKNFYIRRFLRIWPLYFVVIIFSFFIYPGLKEIIGVNTPLGAYFGLTMPLISV